jgi:RNA polymerase sigma-70 factor (ECF subfamily)
MRVIGTSNKVLVKNKAQTTVATIPYKQSEIAKMVEKAADGDIEAFGELYSIYLAPIYRYVSYQVRDKMTAEDIVEEVFVKAWKAIGTCKGKSQTFSAWLYRIAHNHVVNTLRRMNKRVSLESAEVEIETLIEVTNPEQEVEAKLAKQELLEAMACLSQNQRQVIILKFIEGLNNSEIAQILGKREGAIRVLQMRALSKLRLELGRVK